jgi:hypothetical protein
MGSLRTLRLFLGALTVGAALVAPAVASASIEWTQGSSPITTAKTIEIKGTVKTENAVGGVECGVQGNLKLLPGKSGEVTSFQFSKCKTHGEIKTVLSCEAAGGLAEDLPWGVTNTGPEGVRITNANFQIEMTKECLLGPELFMEAPSLTLVPDNPSSIGKFKIGNPYVAEVGDEIQTGIGPSTLAGLLTVTQTGYGVGVTEGDREWVEDGLAIEQDVSIDMNGGLRFNGENGGFQCGEVGMHAIVYQQRFGAEITSVSFKNCGSTGVLYQPYGCTVSELKATLPWKLETGYTRLTVPNLKISGKIGGAGCLLGTFPFGVQGQIHLTPDSLGAITEFSPEGTVEMTTGNVEVSSENGLAVTPSGAYGIN